MQGMFWRRYAEVAKDEKETGRPLRPSRCRVASEPRYMVVMSRSLVSGRKISATTKLIAATTIGYHNPE
jgi:hypothetical protein